MTAIELNLPDSQAARLQELANRFNMPMNEFLQQHILERLDSDAEELARIADRVFEKNDELLRRLA